MAVDLALIMANGDALARQGGNLVGSPLGVLPGTSLRYGSADQTITSTETALHGSACNATVTRPANRLTRFLCQMNISGDATTLVYVRVYYSGTQKYLFVIHGNGGHLLTSPTFVLPANTAVAVGWTVQLNTGTAAAIQASSFQATSTQVEDCGPA